MHFLANSYSFSSSQPAVHQNPPWPPVAVTSSWHLMEPMSNVLLWRADTFLEKLLTELLALGRQRSHLQLLCSRASHKFLMVLRSGGNTSCDSICTPAVFSSGVTTAAECGLMNGGDDLLHSFISASHDIMELRKLSLVFISEWPDF